MAYFSDTKPVTYMAAGPVFASETLHEAVGANTAHSVAGHLLNKPIQGVTSSPAPGHGLEQEPVGQAERAAQDAANGTADTPFSHATVASDIRQAVRPGTGTVSEP